MNFSISNTNPYYAKCTLPTIDGKNSIDVIAFHSSLSKAYILCVEPMKKNIVLTLQAVGRKTEKSFNEFLKRPDLLDCVAEFCRENNFSLPIEWLKKKMTLGFYLPHLSEPTYFFKTGDSVILGNLENIVVTKVYEDGKIYEVEFDAVGKKDRRIEFWHNLRPSRKENDSSFVQNHDLRINFQNRTVYSLIYAYYNGGIDMNPSYQRELVWDENDKVSLIDSIFHCVDIGKFVFVHLPFSTNGAWDEILDGKQRINALIEFYENRFKYKGKFFNELSIKDKCHFENYTVSWADVPEITEEQKLRYFLMLNTGGKSVSTEHLDKIREMLKEV